MCGLIGYVSDKLPARCLQQLLNSMLHRGPDGEGSYRNGRLSMGMRRLSVIDVEGGGQPLLARGGRVVAFQNGEVYNYRILRNILQASGYVFRTQSDTEVLAHGYDAWGIDGLLSRLDGMYAIAIYDEDTNELHIARDRFGEKPLFYTHRDDSFAFGSTLLSMSVMPWVSGEVSPSSVASYFAMHFVPGRQTILKDVSRVLPGERLTLNMATSNLERYTYYTPSLSPPRRVDDAELLSCIEASVRSRLVADVPVGIFLSGGIDSALLAAISIRENPEIETFSIGFEDPAMDESAAARKTADVIGAKHHQFLFQKNHFPELLGAVSSALDEPIGDQATLPLHWLSREARRYVKVVLSGEGADEIFAGYDYYKPFVDDGVWSSRIKKLLDPRSIPFGANNSGSLLDETRKITSSGFPLLTNREERSKIANFPSSDCEWETEICAWLDQSYDPLQRATAADLKTWLPDDLLVKSDRITMAHSLEARAPYLSPQLVELAMNLLQEERMTTSGSKLALRRVARHYLPDEIVDRRKQGFVLPMRSWLREWFAEWKTSAAYFVDRPLSVIDPDYLARLVQSDLDSGVHRERLLFATIMLLEWWTTFQKNRNSLVGKLDLVGSLSVT